MNSNIRKYGFLQISLVIIFGLYTLGMTFGMVYFFDSFSSPPSEASTVTVTLLIQSNHTDYQISFTNTSIIPINRSLLDHLNLTIGRDNWSGVNYGVYGWFINRIFNASESTGWHWFYYYRESGASNWSYSSVGVSRFIINRDFDIKFVYETS
jgi:hypothetical protein